MSWEFGGVRVYAKENDGKREQVIARLQPIGAGTILHIWGYDDEIRTFSGLVATDADISTLEGFTQSGLSYTLSGAEGVVGDYFVSSLQYTRTPDTCIVLFDRPGLDPVTPVYDVSLELFKDE